MKKWNKIWALCLLLTVLTACEKEMMDYEGKPGIYFHVQTVPASKYGDPSIWARADTSVVAFAKTLDEEIEMSIPVQVMGYAANYDRYFEIRIVDTATTAKVDVDYTPIATRYVIPADSVEGFVKFKLKRTDALSDTTLKITLDLIPTSDFDLPMNKWRKLDSDYSDDRLINIVRHVITFNDNVYRPLQWNLVNGTNYYWGIYSDKKMRLMLEVCQMLITEFDDYMVGSKKLAIGVKVDAYLRAEEAEGRTVYEDEPDKDGNKIKMTMGRNVI